MSKSSEGPLQLVTQREIDQRFDALQKLLDERADADRRAIGAAMAASEKAVDKAEDAQRIVNETQASETEKRIAALTEEIAELKRKEDGRSGGEHGRGLQTATLLTVAGLLIAVCAVLVVLIR